MDIEAISEMKTAEAMAHAQVSLRHGQKEQTEAVMSILLQGITQNAGRSPEQTGRQLNIAA
jgi:hypothetical protein